MYLILASEQKTSSGIIIPDTSKEKPSGGVVLPVGAGKLVDKGQVLPLNVKVGDRILLRKTKSGDLKL